MFWGSLGGKNLDSGEKIGSGLLNIDGNNSKRKSKQFLAKNFLAEWLLHILFKIFEAIKLLKGCTNFNKTVERTELTAN